MSKTKFLSRKYTGTEAQTTLFFLDGVGTTEEEYNYYSSFEQLDEEEIISRVRCQLKEKRNIDVLVKVNSLTLIEQMVKLPVPDLMLLTELSKTEPYIYEDIINQVKSIIETKEEEE